MFDVVINKNSNIMILHHDYGTVTDTDQTDNIAQIMRFLNLFLSIIIILLPIRFGQTAR